MDCTKVTSTSLCSSLTFCSAGSGCTGGSQACTTYTDYNCIGSCNTHFCSNPYAGQPYCGAISTASVCTYEKTGNACTWGAYYTAPSSTITDAFDPTVTGGSANLTTGVRNPENVNITYYDISGPTRRHLKIRALFGDVSDVNLASLSFGYSDGKVWSDLRSVTGVGSGHTLYLQNTKNAGVYVCPSAHSEGEISSVCSNRVRWSYQEASVGTTKTVNGRSVSVSMSGGEYVIDNLADTGVSEGTTVNLTVWDQTDAGMPLAGLTKYPFDTVLFFANFTNASGLPANTTGGACQIDYAPYDGWQPMTFNSTYQLFLAQNTFASAGTIAWNVTCFAIEGISANDTVVISELTSPSVTPEFSTWAMIVAIGAVITGTFLMRRKY